MYKVVSQLTVRNARHLKLKVTILNKVINISCITNSVLKWAGKYRSLALAFPV